MIRISSRTRSLLLGVGLASMLLLAACGQRPAATPAAAAAAEQQAPAAPVGAVSAGRGDVQQSLAYSGDIRAREQVSVLPKTAGRIEQVLVDVGSRVKAGDTLAVL